MIEREVKALNCVILIPLIGQRRANSSKSDAEEATGLAEALGLEVAIVKLFRLSKVSPSALFGLGQVELVTDIITSLKIDLVYVDHKLTPGQQAALERKWQCKVMDRQGIILEIFALRARTKEGVLQVELARLEYEKSRLVRTWTHLERQRGGRGFMGGPGETQLEADKRFFNRRIKSMKKQLAHVRKVRQTQRAGRIKSDSKSVALVGYTNAGKSTLFNALTKSSVLAKDELFATLDPTVRRIELPDGHKIYMSDTVGFIRDLPPELVSSFLATLEEVTLADVICHVQDVSDPLFERKRKNVLDILDRLDICVEEESVNIIDVFNKTDLLDEESQILVEERVSEDSKKILFVSALEEKNMNPFKSALEDLIFAGAGSSTEMIPGSTGS